MSAAVTGGRDVWERLLWREYREGRAALLLGLLLPAVVFHMAGQYPAYGLRGALQIAGTLGVHLVVLFWAVSKGDRMRGGADFELVHLPVRPIAALTASFIVPGLASAVVGAVYGMCISPEPGFAAAGAIDVMSTFVFGYFFAAVHSRWLAVLVGMGTVMWAKLVGLDSMQITRDIDATLISVSCAIGAGVGLYVFTKLVVKKPLPYRQLAALGMMAVFGLVPGLARIDPAVFDWRQWTPHELQPPSPSAIVYQGCGVEVTYQGYGGPGGTTVVFQTRNGVPYPRGRGVTARLEGQVKTIEVLDRRYVYFAQQIGESAVVSIIEWETPSLGRVGGVREVARFRARRLAIPDDRAFDAVSPDRAFALVSLNALIGSGQDVWIVDLKAGKAAVLRSGCYTTFRVRTRAGVVWTRNYAIAPLDTGPPVVVDLSTLSEVPFKIPLATGGPR